MRARNRLQAEQAGDSHSQAARPGRARGARRHCRGRAWRPPHCCARPLQSIFPTSPAPAPMRAVSQTVRYWLRVMADGGRAPCDRRRERGRHGEASGAPCLPLRPSVSLIGRSKPVKLASAAHRGAERSCECQPLPDCLVGQSLCLCGVPSSLNDFFAHYARHVRSHPGLSSQDLSHCNRWRTF